MEEHFNLESCENKTTNNIDKEVLKDKDQCTDNLNARESCNIFSSNFVNEGKKSEWQS